MADGCMRMGGTFRNASKMESPLAMASNFPFPLNLQKSQNPGPCCGGVLFIVCVTPAAMRSHTQSLVRSDTRRRRGRKCPSSNWL